MSQSPVPSRSPWPHRLAVALVCATFPLIFVGGLVTTTKAGMAVPDWPTTYGYNLFLYPLSTWLLGPWDLFVEHGHRLLGALVGFLTILLAVAIFRGDERRWLRILAIVAIVAVIGQGVLGGMRVRLDARTLAKIHGCAGPAFLGLAVALAVFTSRLWSAGGAAAPHPKAGPLRQLACLSTILAYLQLVLGAQVRHIDVGATAEAYRSVVLMHLVLAAVLVFHLGWLALLARAAFAGEAALRWPIRALSLATLLQVALGAATWVVKFGWPDWVASWGIGVGYVVAANSFFQALIVTAHVATGSLIFALSLVIALRSARLFIARREPAGAVHFRSLLGVAA